MRLLTALAGDVPDREDALTIDGRACSWSDLQRRAMSVAARIHGAPAVATCATASIDTIVAICAGLAAGVPVVPVPPDVGPVERAHILRDSGAVAMLGASPWEDQPLPVVSLEPTASPLSPAEPSPDAVGLIMYTSGTTGLPKGALLSRRALAADLDALAEAWQWTAEDHLVHGLPLFHVHGLVLGVLGALRVGCRLTHTGRPAPAAYAHAHGTLYFGVPTVWSRVVADASAARELAGARLLVSGSAPLPVSVFGRVAELTGHRPVERYGMTETLITVSTRAAGERRAGFVGRPLRGVETRLRAEDGSPVECDGVSIGELQVRGATMFDGYLSGGRETDFTLDGWFVTGDAATIGEDGFHRIVGRMSVDIIKSGGYKVGAGEVEAVLLDYPAVAEVAVVGMPDDDLGERIVAFVVAEPGVAGDAAAIGAYAAEHLTHHKRPREVRVVESLPRNAMGKVVKKTLRDW
jgi:fatty acid CoA ligase FadD36